MSSWTSEEKIKILLELDKRKLPFRRYTFSKNDSGLHLLGRGASAEVYGAETRNGRRKNYAIKVIGFNENNGDSEIFRKSVRIQEKVKEDEDDVVEIYDSVELWVIFDDMEEIMEVLLERPEAVPERYLKLQFILMEQVACIFSREKSGRIRITPRELEEGNEKELLKFAYDIGEVLKRAHGKMVLHRDIKLENAFYSPYKEKYKIGDFGISTVTDTGAASTVAFTRGYGAPEVIGIQDDKYDNTADIYSFGMMLFVLANHMKFPGSASYSVNAEEQYRSGYVLPRPESRISKKFYNVMKKACRYDPDDRYQSMDELLADLDKIVYSEEVVYKKNHIEFYSLLESILFTGGLFVWKFTMNADLLSHLSIWEYLFLLMCVFGMYQERKAKSVYWLRNIGLLVVVVVLYTSGFRGWTALLMLYLVCCSSYWLTGNLAVGILTVNLVSKCQETLGMKVAFAGDYNWIAAALFSISICLILHSGYIPEKQYEPQTVKTKGNRNLVLSCILFGELTMGVMESEIARQIYYFFFGRNRMDLIYSTDLRKIGITGFIFCVFWLLREQILVKRQRRSEESS